MKTILNAIMKFIAFILAGMLVFVLPISLVANNAGDVLFSEETLNGISNSVILDSDIISAALEIITNRQAEDISNKIEDTDQPEGQQLNLFNLIYSMEEDNWKNFRNALLSDQVVGNWVTGTVTGLFQWLNSEEQLPDISWDLAAPRRKHEGARG